MDYDFFKDEYEQPCVQCSMEYEAMGVYLTEEVNTAEKVNVLLEDIQSIQAKKIASKTYDGKEFKLFLDLDDASVKSNLLESMPDDEIPEELEYYDSQSESICGLDDFLQLLEDWLAFLGER
ncbi:YacL family protein [Marinicellulosiphila megalodicopiae]|uniref:UPF0231 family protein n=1 Tax=Marinicellulosiphila megalodicopiae TaxID=2724896 RepID=UPI003BAFCDAF